MVEKLSCRVSHYLECDLNDYKKQIKKCNNDQLLMDDAWSIFSICVDKFVVGSLKSIWIDYQMRIIASCCILETF